MFNLKIDHVMRNLFLTTIVSLFVAFSAYSQTSFGLKGGVNYNSNGQLFDNVAAATQDPSKTIGYHIGLYAKQDFNKWYIKPELFYTRTSSNYEIAKFDMSKIDMPVLVGINFGTPFSIFAGPSLQYIIDTSLGDFELGDVPKDFTIGLNVGVGFQISNFGVDLRYERGLSTNEADFTGISEGRIDTRPDQIIISLSVKL